jgi:hypothetical protein
VPCASCPWRTSTESADIPGGGIDHDLATYAKSAEWGGKNVAMACHLSKDGSLFACAGWIEKVVKPCAYQSGPDAIPMRLLLMTHRIDPNEYSDGGFDLRESMEDLLDAHPRER